ncbi:MAG: glycosyltransferase family 4 protein [Desulfobacterales bacterium]|nr:glycosyltransferase family 4 protein [Desulfobacterales bacterium]
MNLLMISHKEMWADPDDPGRYVTVGGFPYHLRACAELFDSSCLIATLRSAKPISGVQPLSGRGLRRIIALPEPAGKNTSRKIAMLYWLPLYLPVIWKSIRRADAVHALVPGDVGMIGLLLALMQRKALFVRHCGTWGKPKTIADHFLLWLLERIAGGRNVVMATGGGAISPSERNLHIKWIHSTTLTRDELDQIPKKRAWKPGMPLHLVTVGRVTNEKNMIATIRALPDILKHYSNTILHIVGDGPALGYLKSEAAVLKVSKNVKFHGNVSHDRVMEILHQGHLFLFPTLVKEGFPKAVLEALACGLPVIATAVSVLPHLIAQRNGIVLDNPTPEALSDAVNRIISEPEQFYAMVQSAQETSREFTLEKWQSIIADRLKAAWGQPLRGKAKEMVS